VVGKRLLVVSQLAISGRWPGIQQLGPTGDQGSPVGHGPQSDTGCSWAPFSFFFLV
jgi:hypothetical protein